MILTLTAHLGPHPLGKWGRSGYSPRPLSAVTTLATAAET